MGNNISVMYTLYRIGMLSHNYLSLKSNVLYHLNSVPEPYLYITHLTNCIAIVPTDVSPYRAWQPLHIPLVPRGSLVVSGSGGLLASVDARNREILVQNPLTKAKRTIPFPINCPLSNIGPLVIYLDEATLDYWLYLYIYGEDCGLYRYSADVRHWDQPVQPLPQRRRQHDELQMVGQDVWMFSGNTAVGYDIDGQPVMFEISLPTLPTSFTRLGSPTFKFVAFIGDSLWLMHTERVTTPAATTFNICVFSLFLDLGTVGNTSQLAEWSFDHVLCGEDAQGFLRVLFDNGYPLTSTNTPRNRACVTADAKGFYVCDRNDTVAYRYNPNKQLVESIPNQMLFGLRINAIAMHGSFVNP